MMYKVDYTATVLTKMLRKMAAESTEGSLEYKEAMDGLAFVAHARVALLYSPGAASLTNTLRVSQCTHCGKPVAVVGSGFGKSTHVDYGRRVSVVTSDAGVQTGGLQSVVIRNETGIHIGLPEHVCDGDAEEPKCLTK